MAVVVAVELENPLSSRISAGEPDGAHRRLRPRVGHPDHLHGRNGTAHEVRELDFELRRGAEGRTFPGRGLYGLDDLGVRMPEDEGTVAHHVVDIRVAVHVEDARTSPRSTNKGSPPTGRNARTGLFTPPGIIPAARSISLAERSMASIVLASTLSPLPCKRASPLR